MEMPWPSIRCYYCYCSGVADTAMYHCWEVSDGWCMQMKMEMWICDAVAAVLLLRCCCDVVVVVAVLLLFLRW